jgi:hypothetical protein
VEEGIMADDNSSRLFNRSIFGTLLGKRHDIWQMKFLTASKFAEFSDKRGLSLFEGTDLIRLWQLGLLKADLIKSPEKFQRPGIVEHGKDSDGWYIYTDERTFPLPLTDWESEIDKLEVLSPDIEILFHPFRFYVLFHIERHLLRVKKLQHTKFPFKYISIPDINSFVRWSHSERFIPQVEKWNDSVSLAVIAEPCAYGRIIHSLSMNMSIYYQGGWETLYRLIDEHQQDVVQVYKMIGIEHLKEVHQEFCFATQMLDPNEAIHTLICLGRGDLRLKLEGHLGGAIFLRTMSEILRRVTEETFEQLLQEEDECGPGWSLSSGRNKIQIYGSDRLLDGDRHIANDFLRHFGLNFGFRLRWYVEGQTEWYALNSYFQEIGATDIDVVNLHGEVAQRGQRGIAFRESLRADMRMEVFSIVSIDGDVSDNVRAVRKAADDDEVCGKFFISIPDFEFANFELFELEDVLWQMAEEQGAIRTEREQLKRAIESAENTTALLRCAKLALPQSLSHISKNVSWAEHLMDYALQHRMKRESRKGRPILDAIKWALYITRTTNVESYKEARRNYRVDRNSGELVSRT